jgi:16S rRNA (cytidine1402-2'-O)-methyltransferase
VVVVIEGGTADQPQDVEALAARVDSLIQEGVSRKEAAARVAQESGVSRRTLYEASLRRHV